MQRLKTFPSRRIVIALTLLALVATVLVWLQMRTFEVAMQAQGGYGIIAYELAFRPEQTEAILSAWGPGGQRAARSSLLVDFAFMPSYGLLFAGVCLLIARAQRGWLQTVGLWLALGSLTAALLDALENVMLLLLLGTTGNVPALPPMVAGVCASVKFALLALALIYWVISGIGWAISYLRGAPPQAEASG